MFDTRSLSAAAALLLMTAPALAQSSYPATIGSRPAPATGTTPGMTLGIAAAASANDRPVTASGAARTKVAASTGPLRSSTR